MNARKNGEELAMSKMSRRGFLQATGAAGAGALVAGLSTRALAAKKPKAPAEPAAEKAPDPNGPKFRLGIVTYNIAATWDLPTILKVLPAAGVRLVEFRTTHKHGVEPSLSKEQRQTVKKQCADAGVTIWGSGTVCEFHSANPAEVQKNIETCKQFIDLVKDLGGNGVKVRPNGLRKDVPPEQTLEQIGKALIPCGQAAADAGLQVYVEIHGKETANCAMMKKVMEACGHPKVGLCWNSNASDVVKGSVAENFQLVRPWLMSCHINELWKDATGEYPYRELFRLMRETAYDKVTLCEVGKVSPDPVMGEEILRYYKAMWTELSRKPE
jgi:hypothetical protein